jgi:DNA polymerase-3 subunit gamma/tau
VSANRLIYLASNPAKDSCGALLQLQPPHNAELCLLRLCDESLSGDLTALAARIERLEQGIAGEIPSGPQWNKARRRLRKKRFQYAER